MQYKIDSEGINDLSRVLSLLDKLQISGEQNVYLLYNALVTTRGVLRKIEELNTPVQESPKEVK